jgi:predicted anti-sigma-YlaC factor YlaD
VICSQARLALGAYVVGTLDPAERSAIDRHLARCPACRDELAGLAGLPALLGRLSAGEVVAGPPRPGPALLDRTLAELRHRRRRRLAVATAAVAAGVVLAGTAVVVTREPPPAPVTATSHGVRAEVTMQDRNWGTLLAVRVAGTYGAHRCQLVVIGRDGQREVAASWATTGSGEVRVTGATSIPQAQVTSVSVALQDGTPLVTVWP